LGSFAVLKQFEAVFEPGSKPRQGFMLGHYTTRAFHH